MLNDCVYITSIAMTTPPWWREKVVVYIIIDSTSKIFQNGTEYTIENEVILSHSQFKLKHIITHNNKVIHDQKYPGAESI